MSSVASDFSALEKALNDASGKASVLWTTFVTFEVYLSVAFGAVKHRDLFLERSVSLPILNVELPLVAFFFVAPTIFLILHSYVFLQLLALAEKSRCYDHELSKLRFPADDSQLMRQRLDSFLVLQFLAGPESQRAGFQGRSLRIIAWITLVAAPVIILLQAQVTFLAYHNAAVTWIQRVLLITDLAVIWFAWDRLRTGDQPILGQGLSRFWPWIGGTLSAVLVGLSVLVVTFPGERVDGWMAPFFRNPRSVLPLHDWLFSGSIDEVSGKPLSLFSDRLVLVDQSFIDDEKIAKVEVSHSFRGRDLRGAFLKRADLRKVDFTGADLEEASLDGAKLQQASFGCGQRGGTAGAEGGSPTEHGCASLRRASLFRAQLQGAVLNEAFAEGASFLRAGLQGAKLFNAHLRSANLDGAQFQGASMDGADLRDTSLRCVAHDGAAPDCTGMEGASVEDARFEGAVFEGAHLQGACFDGAGLKGARLGRAFLPDLARAGPASAVPASGDGRWLSTQVWRTRVTPEMAPSMVLEQVDCSGKPWDDMEQDRPNALTGESPAYERWLEETLAGLFPGEDRERVRRRLKRLSPATLEPPDHKDDRTPCAVEPDVRSKMCPGLPIPAVSPTVRDGKQGR